jgi:hypothetical protein
MAEPCKCLFYTERVQNLFVNRRLDFEFFEQLEKNESGLRTRASRRTFYADLFP